MLRTFLIAAGLVLGLTPGAYAQNAGKATSNAPAARPQAAGTASQTTRTPGSSQNAAASVTQPGMPATVNSGKSQNGNYGTGIAGGRADPNPFPAAK